MEVLRIATLPLIVQNLVHDANALVIESQLALVPLSSVQAGGFSEGLHGLRSVQGGGEGGDVEETLGRSRGELDWNRIEF